MYLSSRSDFIKTLCWHLKGEQLEPDKGEQSEPDKGQQLEPDKDKQLEPDKGLQLESDKYVSIIVKLDNFILEFYKCVPVHRPTTCNCKIRHNFVLRRLSLWTNFI